MPVETQTSSLRIPIEELTADLVETMRRTVDTRAEGLRAFLESQWPNESNSGPQASGRPSQATGTSSKALEIDITGDGPELTVSLVVGDDINPKTGQPASEYAEYVHYTGGATGGAAASADASFNRGLQGIIEDTTTAINAHVARLGG
ncbi:hypothetical protein H8E07_15120 [bacterium]|nr:hypothetical protein [bacterium]